jgi:hypothetical protein
MWRRVDIFLNDVSEERIASIIRVNKISTRRHIPEDGILQVIAVKTSNLTR